MRFITRVTIPPFEYPIYLSATPIKAGDRAYTSGFWRNDKIVIMADDDTNKVKERLTRELFNAWHFHWPGPDSPERRRSFETWLAQVLTAHFPGLASENAQVLNDSPDAELVRSTRTAKTAKPLARKLRKQQLRDRATLPTKSTPKEQTNLLKQMDITNFVLAGPAVFNVMLLTYEFKSVMLGSLSC